MFCKEDGTADYEFNLVTTKGQETNSEIGFDVWVTWKSGGNRNLLNDLNYSNRDNKWKKWKIIFDISGSVTTVQYIEGERETRGSYGSDNQLMSCKQNSKVKLERGSVGDTDVEETSIKFTTDNCKNYLTTTTCDISMNAGSNKLIWNTENKPTITYSAF